MKSELSLGTSPWGENCAQTIDASYSTIGREECQRWIKLLRSTYEKFHSGNFPEGLRFKIKTESHDFGMYYDVVVVFDDSDEAAVTAAYWLDENTPEKWEI